GRRAREPELARVQRLGPLEVLAHVTGPVGNDATARVAIPRVAARPGRACEARLQLAVAGFLDVAAHLDRAGAAREHLLDGLAHVAGLRLEVEDDRAARGVRVR